MEKLERSRGEVGPLKAVIDALIGHEGDTGKIYSTVGEEALRAAAAAGK